MSINIESLYFTSETNIIFVPIITTFLKRKKTGLQEEPYQKKNYHSDDAMMMFLELLSCQKSGK